MKIIGVDNLVVAIEMLHQDISIRPSVLHLFHIKTWRLAAVFTCVNDQYGDCKIKANMTTGFSYAFRFIYVTYFFKSLLNNETKNNDRNIIIAWSFTLGMNTRNIVDPP